MTMGSGSANSIPNCSIAAIDSSVSIEDMSQESSMGRWLMV